MFVQNAEVHNHTHAVVEVSLTSHIKTQHSAQLKLTSPALLTHFQCKWQNIVFTLCVRRGDSRDDETFSLKTWFPKTQGSFECLLHVKMAGRDCATLQVGGGESRFGEFLGVFCEKRLPLTSGARVVCSRLQAKASLARAQAFVVSRGRQDARGSCGDGGHRRSKYTVVGEKIKQKNTTRSWCIR